MLWCVTYLCDTTSKCFIIEDRIFYKGIYVSIYNDKP